MDNPDCLNGVTRIFVGWIGNPPGLDVAENIGIGPHLAVRTTILRYILPLAYRQDSQGMDKL
jgi:hypothetical protein